MPAGQQHRRAGVVGAAAVDLRAADAERLAGRQLQHRAGASVAADDQELLSTGPCEKATYPGAKLPQGVEPAAAASWSVFGCILRMLRAIQADAPRPQFTRNRTYRFCVL